MFCDKHSRHYCTASEIVGDGPVELTGVKNTFARGNKHFLL